MRAPSVRAEDDLRAARRHLSEGLRVARQFGFGIYHIELLLMRAHVALFEGNPEAAIVDLEMALHKGFQPPPGSDQEALPAAADSEHDHSSGKALGQHLMAEARLLQAAQILGRPRVADFEALPAAVDRLIQTARAEIDRSRQLRREICDPRIEETERLIRDLEDGVLTRYPWKTH